MNAKVNVPTIDFSQAQGKCLVFSGFEKGSGKTTSFTYAASSLRKNNEVVLMSIGLDGELKNKTNNDQNKISVKVNDIVLTSRNYADCLDAKYEVLEVFNSRTCFGGLFLGRVKRPGSVMLAGPESFDELSTILNFIYQERTNSTILIDGSVNRITQANLGLNTELVYSFRVDYTNIQNVCDKIKALVCMNDWELNFNNESKKISGIINKESVDNIPDDIEKICIDDFTKIFLTSTDILRFSKQYKVSVCKKIKLFMIIVILKNLTKVDFLNYLKDKDAENYIQFNPYEVTYE